METNMKIDVKNSTYIKEIAQIMNTYNLSKIKIAEHDKKGSEVFLERLDAFYTNEAGNIKPQISDVNITNLPITETVSVISDTNKNSIDIKSPIVGIFYSSSSPEVSPFIKIGDNVKKGDVLCILEAMKLMNEICAEYDGKIVDICVKNGDIVEFNQLMFKLEIN
ncbi:MAG: acetyl-CoA carboxylase biotin carboxyl carrier protein subunit [Defluviitaleaceae bacterium]|nr:acetyl-CoA carboxylase biotin carboxyl carrier protein subunit [Defluviitaleaceae bacterium]